MKRSQNGRRDFLKSSAATAAGLAVLSAFPRKVLGANDRLRVGLIGCGGCGNHPPRGTVKSAGEVDLRGPRARAVLEGHPAETARGGAPPNHTPTTALSRL